MSLFQPCFVSMNNIAWVLLGLVGVGVVVGSWALMRMPSGLSGDAAGISTTDVTSDVAEAGRQLYHLELNGEEREFLVYRPEDLVGTDEVPVVFVYHGSGGNGPKFFDTTGWKVKADEEGLMVVFPTAMKYHIFDDEKVVRGVVRQDVRSFQTKWNSYELPGLLDADYPDQVLADDVQFTKEIISFLDDKYAIETDKMYVTGFSNGAQMTTRLMVEMSDVFAAFAPVGGGITPDQVLEKIVDEDADPTPRPIIQMIGEVDPKLTHHVGVTVFSLDESSMDPGNAVYDTYVENILSIQELADAGTYEYRNQAAIYTYDQSTGAQDNIYQLIIVKGMQHIYPNGINAPFDVADYFWPFFERYSL